MDYKSFLEISLNGKQTTIDKTHLIGSNLIWTFTVAEDDHLCEIGLITVNLDDYRSLKLKTKLFITIFYT